MYMGYNQNSESRLHYHAKYDVAEWIKQGALGDEYKDCKALFEYQICNLEKGFTCVNTWRSLGYKESPSYQECVKYGYKPLRSIDVVLVKDGKVVLGIEIFATSKCKSDKIRLLKALGMRELIEIDAEFCSRQMKTLTRPLQYDVLIPKPD
jgi:hypothetical protein